MSGKRKDRLWQIARIIQRDGTDCFVCGGPLDFAAEPGTDWYPSIEHVEARMLGGHNRIDNLALSHRWCNSKRTTDESRRKKSRMRQTGKRRPRR